MLQSTAALQARDFPASTGSRCSSHTLLARMPKASKNKHIFQQFLQWFNGVLVPECVGPNPIFTVTTWHHVFICEPYASDVPAQKNMAPHKATQTMHSFNNFALPRSDSRLRYQSMISDHLLLFYSSVVIWHYCILYHLFWAPCSFIAII